MGETGEVPQEIPKTEVPKTHEVEKPPLDAILVFGQGPVVDQTTREKASDVKVEVGFEDVNLWSKNLARAAAELFKRGQTREVIVMGGRTGGEAYQSESELIAKILHEEYGVPLEAIKLEGRSTNTLENLVNLLNEYLDKNSEYKDVGILSANFHLPRTKLLMQLLDIPYGHAFSAEEVTRYAARFDEQGREREQWDEQTLLEIERMLDMGEASTPPVSPKDKVDTYYQQQSGTEQKNIAKRGQEEDVWSRALLEMPEYWLCYLGNLKNGERMRNILAGQDQHMLEERFGIDMSSDSDDVLRQKLLKVGRILPNLDEWVGQDWSKDTKERLEGFIEERAKKKL